MTYFILIFYIFLKKNGKTLDKKAVKTSYNLKRGAVVLCTIHCTVYSTVYAYRSKYTDLRVGRRLPAWHVTSACDATEVNSGRVFLYTMLLPVSCRGRRSQIPPEHLEKCTRFLPKLLLPL